MSVAEETAPTVSVVMCTRNRHDTIGAAVASVLACDYPSFDLTVVDQSTSGATEELLRPIAAANPRLRYMRVAEPGLSRAYNTGIRSSSGEILAFTDDDCVAPRDWLTAIVRTFANDPEAGLLYGQVLPPPDEPPGGVTPVLAIPYPQRLSRRDGFKVFGMGANFAARRSLFDTVGLFDEVLGGGGPLRSSQDFDLAYRVYHAGVVILLRPDVTVLHYGTRTQEQWPSTLEAYGIGNGAFYFKHVRCRDPYALWLLGSHVVHSLTKYLGKRALRRDTTDLVYIRSVFAGIWQSLLFPINHQRRVYIQR